MSQLLSQGGFGCVYYPGITCKGKTNHNKSVVTKLQKKDFNAENEINIGKLIKTIPNYGFYFLPIISDCPINIRKVDKKIISKCNVINMDIDSYILMDIPYIPNKPFFDILIDTSEGKKQTISRFINSFKYLLNSIHFLLEKKIVHYDLKGDNILYNTKTMEPQIIDFGISIPISQLTPENRKDYFYVFAPEYYLWPLEVHIINFLLHYTETDLTKEDALKIADLYANSNKSLLIFSENFRAQFKKACTNECLKYVKKNRNEVIDELIKHYVTWDNYALSALYLRVYEYFFPLGFHRNTLLIHFSQLLLLNLNPNPDKRLSIKDTTKQFSDMFYMEGDVNDYMEIIIQMDYDSKIATKKINEDILALNTSIIKQN